MERTGRPSALALASGLSVLLACGTRELIVAAEEGEVCVDDGQAANTENPCSQGFRCEPVADGEGESVCAVPLQVRGEVLNALTGEPVHGALIIALDGEGIAVSDAVTSDAQGRYEVELVAGRQPDGQLATSVAYTLQVSAQDYAPYPFGVRSATPLDPAQSVLETRDDADEGTRLVLESTATRVELFQLALTDDEKDEDKDEDEDEDEDEDAKLAEPGSGGTIRGALRAPAGALQLPPGTLVVAEGAETPAPYGIVDRSGRFTIFNVPAGTVAVSAYRSGLEVAPLTVDIAAGDIQEIELMGAVGDEAAGRVTGVVSIIDAAAAERIVALIPSAVLHPGLGRGPIPVGMRSTALGATADAAAEFTIAGVPSGRYTVVASIDDDGLVTLSESAAREVEVAGGEESLLPQRLDLTGALTVLSPAPLEGDVPPRVGGKPTFTFADDPDEAGYIVRIYDGRGELTWEKTNVKSVTDAATVEVPYRGKALTSGMWYQFTAIAVADKKDEATALSRSEDRRGVFVAE